ncbi:MAG TPA: DsbA family protein [Solirubrobacteraceae bacterium]|nr:DsbA family protein [Solirubrobacteraceae bacterium]
MQPVFYYDLGSPQCYIVGERIMSALPLVPEWEPVLASQLTAEPELDRSQIERLAAELGLQPLRWPTTWPPPTTETAMLAATYAKKIGRGVAFSLAAFRQTFAGGRDIGDENTILIAGAACEMHPAALTKGLHMASTAQALEAANMRARASGVTTVPAIEIDGRTYEGSEAMALGGAR